MTSTGEAAEPRRTGAEDRGRTRPEERQGNDCQGAPSTIAPRTDALAVLDARDLEILQLLVEGLPTSQVAARLFLAPKTVRNRISEMLSKLGVSSRAEAIALGQAGGLGRS